MYTGRPITDRFEICDKLIPLSCDQAEPPHLVLRKDSVVKLLVAFLYTRVLTRVRSNSNRSVAIDVRDDVVRIEELAAPGADEFRKS